MESAAIGPPPFIYKQEVCQLWKGCEVGYEPLYINRLRSLSGFGDSVSGALNLPLRVTETV